MFDENEKMMRGNRFFVGQPRVTSIVRINPREFKDFTEKSTQGSYLVCFVTDNYILSLIQNNLVSVYKGQMLMIQPSTTYQFFQINAQCYLLQFYYDISGKFFSEFENLEYYFIFNLENNIQLCKILFEQLYNEFHFSSPSKELISSLLECILTLGISQIKNGNKQENNFVENAKMYIENNFTKDITLSDIAVHTNTSISHLSHLFKEKLGISPIKYVIYCRIEMAKKLLENGNLSVYKIANEVGFENEFYFSTLFRKEVGISPGQYRKKEKHNLL